MARVRTVEFLPEIFQTSTNRQFLASTLDQLVQEPSFKKTQGYIGRRIGPGINPTDADYVVEPTAERANYQLEPAVVFKLPDTDTVYDAITYPGITDALKLQGADVTRSDRLYGSQYYAWDPFVNYDKLVNFSEYYWLPSGPLSVAVTGGVIPIRNTIEVTRNSGFYTFSDAQGQNPVITLVRGGSYQFSVAQNKKNTVNYRVTNQGNKVYIIDYQPNPALTLVRGNTYIFTLSIDGDYPFWIKTIASTGVINPYNTGVSNNGAYDGTVTFTVPQNAPNTLYYSSQTSSQMQGVFNIISGEPGTGPGFYIQAQPGVDGGMPTTPNISSRDVLGVVNNGEDLGTVTFNVPSKTAQNFYYNLTSIDSVDLLSQIKFNEINNIYVDDFLAAYPAGIDGVTDLENRTLVFDVPSLEGTGVDVDTAIAGGWLRTTFYSPDYTADPTPGYNEEPYDLTTSIVSLNERYSVWQIQFNTDDDGRQYMTLGIKQEVNEFEKFRIVFGVQWSSTQWYRSDNSYFEQIPLLTAVLDTVFYQDSLDPTLVGEIRLIDPTVETTLDIDTIIGKKQYTSPNGVKFTNGLIVQFRGNVTPESYANNEYFVEGVGEAIVLVPVTELVTPETYTQSLSVSFDVVPYDIGNYDVSDNQPIEQDYITINRASTDRNAWSRSNRWFHRQVLEESASYNNTTPLLDLAARARRPILEFQAGTKLFNSGTAGKNPVNIIDFTTLDAFSDVNGVLNTYIINGYTLVNGSRVIFAADTDPNVRNKIYTVELILPDSVLPLIAQPIINLTVADDGNVSYNNQTVCLNGATLQGKSFWFDGVTWQEAQEKISTNQSPLFDVFVNGHSLADTVFFGSSTFRGSKLFSYAVDSAGVADPILGFPLKYLTINNVGDIVFDNNFYTDTFVYVENRISLTKPISQGFVYRYLDQVAFTRKIGWATAPYQNATYQQFQFTYTGQPLLLDVRVRDQILDPYVAQTYPVIKLYAGSKFRDPGTYTYTQTEFTTIINVDSTIAPGETIIVLALSDQVSSVAFYQVPSNLENNALNQNTNTVTLGTVRTHYQTICENLITIQGTINGSNNSRDLGYIAPYGLNILQQSSPLTLAGYFLRDQNYELFTALDFNTREYTKYKTQLLDIVAARDWGTQTSAQILTNAVAILTAGRTESSPFYWSDMLPARTVYTSTTYTYTPISTSSFNTSRVYDFNSSNYYAVLVYVNDRLLTLNFEYTVAADAPIITIISPLEVGDTIIIQEFDTTVGNYVPNTPTKMGLYPAYRPQMYLDTTYVTPTTVIQGHDGSITVAFDDIRDEILLDFETRIYNNLKIHSVLPINTTEIIPGQFRVTEYSQSEVTDILSADFLTWVGSNKLDYSAQQYIATNPWTYNYSQSSNKLTGAPLLGGWRGIYEYFYDTDRPNEAPWEMLGFTEQPTWWEDRYGAAPYTSGNLVLWDDLSLGRVADPAGAYILPQYARPGLTQVLPVDGEGALIPPLESVVGLYSRTTFQRSWKIGDDGPVENAWRTSSSYPFAIMRLFALTRPAKFFSLLVDRDLYKYDTALDQYLYNGRYRIDANTIELYGNGVSKASYINWIVDYNTYLGNTSTTAVLKQNLKGLGVQLAYRMASFSDKLYIKVYTEKPSPNSLNTSLLLPDDSYDLFLYKNQPSDDIVYSSIIVQRVPDGYNVFGYGILRPYFEILISKPTGARVTISAGNTTATVPTTYSNDIVQVPYGYVFTNETAVCDFILSYGALMSARGMIFDDVENGLTLNWAQMAQEFLYWSNQGWGPGSIINLNPTAQTLMVTRPGLIVDSIVERGVQTVLQDQNRQRLAVRDLVVDRYDNTFKVTSQTEQTINYIDLKFTAYEHIVVLKNVSVFGDLIYDPVTAARQGRLLLVAATTTDWNGQLDAQGFILNQNNIKEWAPDVKYTKGQIVTFKNNYYSAATIVEPKSEFDFNDWLISDYTKIQKGLLPNLANKANQIQQSYNTISANLERDQDLLSYGLIGFRPRQYMTALNLDDVSQLNVYKQFLGSKGTKFAIDLFGNASFGKEAAQYTVYENWAILKGVYGAQANRSFFDVRLNQALLTSNPSTVQIIQPFEFSQADQTVTLDNLWRESYKITSPNVLPTITKQVTDVNLPSSGYVNLNDIDITVFDINNPDAINASLSTIGVGTTIWFAKINDHDWGVYRCSHVPGAIVEIADNLDGTSIVVFNEQHNLAVNDLIIIKFFSNNINGVYKIFSVPSINTITIIYEFVNTPETTVLGAGVGLKLETARVVQASDINNLPYVNEMQSASQVWVDDIGDGHWSVLEKENPWTFSQYILPIRSANSEWAYAIAQTQNNNISLISAPFLSTGIVYQYSVNSIGLFSEGSLLSLNAPAVSGYGSSITIGNNSWGATGAPTSNAIGYTSVLYYNGETQSFVNSQLLLALDQPGPAEFGYSVAMSRNERWLYIGAPAVNAVYAYGQVPVPLQYLIYNTTSLTTRFSTVGIQYEYPEQLDVYLNATPQRLGIDYTASLTLITFIDIVNAGQTVTIYRRNRIQLDFYQYVDITPNTSTGVGTGATFNIDVTRGVYSVTINSTGIDYSPGDVLTIYGTQIGGGVPTDNCVVTVTDVTFAGNIADFTITGSRVALQTIFPISQYLFTAQNINSFTVTVNSIIQRPKLDYEWEKSDSSLPDSTLNDYDLVFVTSPAAGAEIFVDAATYYAYAGKITVSGLNTDARFGHSVATNADGSEILIGCPQENYNGTYRAGTAYVFNRSIQRFQVDNAFVEDPIFTVNSNLDFPPAVAVNGVFLNNTAQWGTNDTNTFTVSYQGGSYTASTVTVNQPLNIGNTVDIDTNQFQQVQKITPEQPAERAYFGKSVIYGLFDCAVIVGAPEDSVILPQAGSVQTDINQARLYGTITSTIASPALTAGATLRINNYEVAVPASPNNNVTGLVAAINAASISNIIAAVSSGLVTIDLINKLAAVPYQKLLVSPGMIGTGVDSVYNDLGFTNYVYAQTLTNPYIKDGSNFGASLSTQGVDLLVGAPHGTPHIIDTFDGGDTFFDAGSTVFYTDISQSGAVYQFDYLPSAAESALNPGAFVYGQQLYYNASETNDMFGTSVNYTGTSLMIGAPGTAFETVVNNGALVAYRNANQTQAWTTKHYQAPSVNIYAINSVTLYDRLQSAKTEFLDFFDPLQGKILGAARQNIDLIASTDPANYNIGVVNNQGNTWGASRVGKIWWDTSTVRFVDPGQDDIVYASRQWGQIFPGSRVDVYQWTQSDVPPANYPGPGTPYSITRYSVGSLLNSSGAFVTEYFYWVRNIPLVNTAANKTLSAEVIARYISSPIASGIPFMAPVSPSCIAIYNSSSYLNSFDTIIHVEFDRQINDDNVHTEFQLLAQGRAASFLTPALYRKLQDSFCGVDTQGSAVPDISLSPAERYGVQFRPRQSMFVNRYLALQNYIQHTNLILAQYPIAESRSLTLLNSEEPIPAQAGNWNEVLANLEELSWQNIQIVPLGYKYLILSDSDNNGLWTIYTVELATTLLRRLILTKVQSYDTKAYWSYINWYSPGFNRTSIPSQEVPSYAALVALNVPVGTVVLVTSNGEGKFEIYQLDTTGWNRVGLQDGTIQISNGIWNYTEGKLGFDGEVFDAQYFDQTPQTETRKIIQSINEELFIDELLIERNDITVLMLNYILTEQLAPEWLTKTSLIDVEHNIRELLPYPTYRRDNQDFVLDYLNEVKPYHVQIREFNLRYNGFDNFAGDLADFDLPAYYDADISPPQYVSPILTDTEIGPSDRASNNIIWQTTPYDQWFDNYKLSIEEIVIVDGGAGYTSIPTVTITGTATTPATAYARINSAGEVVAVVLATPGLGYLTTAIVTITGGDGTGARAVAYMGNGLVRSIFTTVKFDRCEYQTNISDWEPNITFDNGQLVRYDAKIWAANSPDSTGVNTPTFDIEDWILVPINDLSGVDRTMGYYVAGINAPGRELPLLIDGIDYPGVQVLGLPLEYDTGFDHGPFDVTPWDNLDFGPEGRPTYSDTMLNAQYQSSFLDIYLGTRPDDINVDGGAFVDTYSSHAPQELVPGQEFDTLDFRVYTRPGSDWNGLGHGFNILALRSEYDPAAPVIYWGDIGVTQNVNELDPVGLDLSNITQQRDLTLGINYTIDWVEQTVTILSGAALNDVLIVDVYQMGGGNQLLRANYNGASVGTILEIAVNSNEIYELVILVNGSELTDGTDYTYEGIGSITQITFYVILTGSDDVSLTVMGNETPQQYSWSMPMTQYITVIETPALATAVLTYPLTNSMSGSNIDNVYVTVNGFMARPSQGIEWYGDGSSAEFLMPIRGGYSQGLIADNEVHVYVNDVEQVLGSEFTVVPWDGFSARTIILTYVPAVGDRILICVNTRADYIISYDGTEWNITFRPSGAFGIFPGDIVAVTSWNDTSQQNIVQKVWVGPLSTGGTNAETYDTYPFDFGTVSGDPGSYDFSEGIIINYNDFNLDRVQQNANRMIVTYNGRRLFNGSGFTVQYDDTTSYLILPFVINVTDVVVATLFTNDVVPEAMAFRIFQDMRGTQATYRILPSSETTLAENVLYDDDVIYVKDAGNLGVPNPAKNIWGVVTIGGERVMYRYRDTVNNSISGLLRGTAGTAAASHPSGTKAIAMGRESILEQGYEDQFVYTNIMANGQQTVFSAPNVDLLNVDSTEYSDALRVLVGGISVPPTQYVLTSPSPATVTFYDPPQKGVQVTLGVLQSKSWYGIGIFPPAPSNGIPLQNTATAAALFLRGVRAQLF